MILKLGVIFTFIAVVLFPWPFTIALTLALSLFEPLLPLAIGMFADTLYYIPHDNFFPLSSVLGATATAIAIFVRSRLKAGIL